jgi:dolichyl-phosphooligosaccharide-protein glycotransferase
LENYIKTPYFKKNGWIMAEEDEIIDIGKWFKKKKHKKESDSGEIPTDKENRNSDDEPISWNSIKAFFSSKGRDPDGSTSNLSNIRKHMKWLVPLVIIIVVFSHAFYLRAAPAGIPQADQWAENNVHSHYKNQIQSQIDRQFPNLPRENKQALIEAEFQKVLKDNKDVVEQQKKATAEQLRSQFKDDTGQTYLLGIDPYFYYRQTDNLLKYGTIGTEVRDGEPFDTYKLAPLGLSLDKNLHPYVGLVVYKVSSIFSDISVMGSFFFVGALISALSIIPAFFIGRKVGGNVGGFFAAWLTAVNVFFVSRTAGESSDTDAYNIFFPLLIAWIYIEAVEQENLKKQIGLMALTGFLMGVYAFAWSGWIFIFYIIFATMSTLIVYQAVISFLRKSFRKDEIIRSLSGIGVFLISSVMSITIFTEFRQVKKLWNGVIGFTQIKSVASSKIWPNVLTTVAELNPQDLSSVIGQLGGLFLLLIAIVGVLLTLTKKDSQGRVDVKYTVMLTFWLASTLWATGKGVRFTLLVVPALALGFGMFCGITFKFLVKWISEGMRVNKSITQVVIFGLLLLLIITPTRASFEQSQRSVPAVNDAWWDALSSIKDNSQQNAIITSWWDFGHWFKAIADRPVTFDGGNQNTPQAHWVGKLLLSDNEAVSLGILRMLDCGGNTAFNEIDKKIKEVPASVSLLNEIILLDNEEAATLLANKGFVQTEIEDIVANTHCKPPEGFVIASDDMIGKSGVWGHFGSWDFIRSAMVFKTRKLPRAEAIPILVNDFNLTEELAGKTYDEIINSDPNRWISPWPSYQGGLHPCVAEGKVINCGLRISNDATVELSIDTLTMDATIPGQQGVLRPNSLTFAANDGIHNIEFDGPTTGFSIILIPRGDNQFAAIISDPLQANSLFTKMYFYEGHGLRCFDPFDNRNQITGGRIFIYKVDWDCIGQHNVFFTDGDIGDDA